MYNVRYTDHESNIASSCIMSDTQITSPSVSDIIHDDAMLDSWSVYLTLYMMTQCWTRDLCIWHYTWWRNVGLVICIWHYTWWRNVGLVTYVIWHYTEWCWTRDLCIWHLQNDAMLDSWSVYLTLYRMASCWTRDLCIWHLQNDAMLDSWSVYLTLYKNDAMLDSWSVHLTLYRMTPCWTRDLCIWHCTEWRHVGLVILWRHSV